MARGWLSGPIDSAGGRRVSHSSFSRVRSHFSLPSRRRPRAAALYQGLPPAHAPIHPVARHNLCLIRCLVRLGRGGPPSRAGVAGEPRATSATVLDSTAALVRQMARQKMELLGYVAFYRVYIVALNFAVTHLTISQAYARYVRLGLGKSFLLGEKRL
ncbi:hypothetical protein C8Q74DRAFT_458315 [Fomes fomentarius]|nr:hypothetical protein C8Q74DRAFT_458315 [Fomes fomentarius]